MSTVAAALAPSLRRDAQVIGLVGVAHSVSHFYHLILASLFPWIKPAFGLSYAELGLLMSVFFIVSGVGQALAGFVVDRRGALVVLASGIACLGIAALGLALSPNYALLLIFSGLAGLGNSIFHPSDFTILNKRVSQPRLAHAFSVHGVSGTLGWAAAPPFLTGIAALSSWRVALLAASVLAFTVLVLLLIYRQSLETREFAADTAKPTKPGSGSVDFLRIPAVWLCFGFFLVTAMALGGIQSFAPAALQSAYGVPLAFATAGIAAYMIASAVGTLVGGFIAAKATEHEKVIAAALAGAGAGALVVASGRVAPALLIPLFALIGFGAGLVGPSRDLLVRAAAPKGATGRVYGVVYSGLDAGLAIAPLLFGILMDAHYPLWVFALIGVFQAMALFTALGVGTQTERRRAEPARA
ncbi:MAG: MFS transporter [Gammaproteobacteria bacterium]